MNSHNNNNDDDDDFSWTPPTEAERKVIEARRERSNKISSLMGQYLLKGYKMLAISCNHCDCILLEDRQNKKYCIACSEVDADTKKDNPAVSEHAARRTVEESQHRLSVADDAPDAEGRLDPAPAFVVLPKGTTSTTTSERYARQVSSESLKQTLTDEVPVATREVTSSDFSPEVAQALVVIKQKVTWATKQLQGATNILECQHLVKLISESFTAISLIEQYKNSW